MNAFFKNQSFSANEQLPGTPEEITIFDLSVEAAELTYSIFDEQEQEKRMVADDFFFQYGGEDEFQMRAEMQALRDRKTARQRHAGHVMNHK